MAIPMGSSKGGCMLPMPPMMFPHPAQLQAMGAAAQAAMAQAAKQPGGMPACFPMGMFLPPAMMQQQQQGSASTTCMQQQQQPCHTSSPPATPAAEAGAAAAAADADDEDDIMPDEDVEVEPELEQIFEKVAAIERAHKAATAAVQQRACSPSGSLHSAATAAGNGSNCSSPSAAAVAPLPMPPAMLCQQGMHSAAAAAPAAAAGGECDAAPEVPWLAFAADDKGDDLDADLAQLITLPGELPKHKSSSSLAGTALAPRIKRVSSVCSAYSSGEALAGAAASALISSSSKASQPQQPKVLRIRSIKGAPGSAVKPAAGSKAGSTGRAPAGPSCKGGSSSSGQQKAAAAGLGPAQAGVLKKVAVGSSNHSSKAKPSAAASPAKKQQQLPASQAKSPQRSQHKPAAPAVVAAAPAAGKAAAAAAAAAVNSPVKAVKAAAPASPAAADEPALSLLGDLDSGLSDTCFGSSGDDMAIDSFAYLDELLMQESSEDAWEGLLGGSATAEELELCSSLACS
uniref:Uncharacterized protein n=1 Tax=Tetradesmus obliquus TaxID=3088 RepID=A0A383V2F5_TETOB|eukprot:jgi/Sobl393_1/444/SZX59757.1